MSDNNYTLPAVWTWDADNGGEWAGINRPIAGPTHQKALPSSGTQALQLYSLGTPNGVKVTVMLEELLALGHQDAAYDLHIINISKGEQFGSGFVELNPNSKIPVMLDKSVEPAQSVFESCAILHYLAEKFDALLPENPADRTACMSWLFWQGGSAPFLGGGFGHFYSYAPYPMEYPIDRYTMEAKRQLDVLDRHLADHEYMCDSGYSIADIAIWPWYGRLVMDELYTGAATFLAAENYVNVLRWARLVAARDPVKLGVAA